MKSVAAILVFVLLAVFGTTLRVQSASARTPHADEAEQAYTFYKLYNANEYKYNPNGPHGPVLYYWAYACQKAHDFLGLKKVSKVEIKTLRLYLLPIFLALLCTFYCMRKKCGIVCVFTAATFWCFSSLATIYSVYFVQESFFSLFVFLSVLFAYKFAETPDAKNAVLLGVFCGLSQCCKETFAIVALAGIIPFLWAAMANKNLFTKAFFKNAIYATLSAAVVYIVFYSSFFTNFSGVADGVLSYIHFADKSESAAHSKEFLYYAKILFGNANSRIFMGETAIAILAVFGGISAFVKKDAFAKYCASFAAIYFVLLSLIAYKTPWLLMSLMVFLCVLAGYFVAALFSAKNKLVKALALVVFISALCFQYKQARFAAIRFANDPRNAFTYVHTLSDYKNFESLAKKILAAKPKASFEFFAQNSLWPIPYLLLENNAQFKSTPQKTDADIVVCDSDKLDSFIDKNAYQFDLFGLRENLILRVYTKKDLYEKAVLQ